MRTGSNRSRESYVYGGGFLQTIFMKGFMSVMFVAVIISSYYICKVIYESVFVFGYQIVTTEVSPRGRAAGAARLYPGDCP